MGKEVRTVFSTGGQVWGGAYGSPGVLEVNGLHLALSGGCTGHI